MKRNSQITLVLLAMLTGMMATLLFQDSCKEEHFNIHADGKGPLSSQAANIKATEIQGAFNDIFQAVSPAVVSIFTEQNVQVNSPYLQDPIFREFFGSRPMNKKQTGLGSGFIINKHGYIVTNHHVAGQVDKITIQLYNGKKYEARLIGTDKETDIALLKIDTKDELPFVYIGNSDEVKVGDWAIALGNPFGLAHTFTVGVVSATSRSDIGNDFGNYIQTDASINPGNSGGPLININGQVIGINRMIYSQSGGSVGIGFAIPINDARYIIEQLRIHKSIKRGWLGVQIVPLNPQEREELGLDEKGVMVYDVYPNSPAKEAGLTGSDIILSINDEEISQFVDLKRIIFRTKLGDKVKLEIIRKGKKKTLYATIESMPKQ